MFDNFINRTQQEETRTKSTENLEMKLPQLRSFNSPRGGINEGEGGTRTKVTHKFDSDCALTPESGLKMDSDLDH